MKYQPTIGLEIHTELKTESKMFCSCANNPFSKEANINICPVCMGHPGTLPVINKKALELVIKTGLALNCEIANRSQFERKNYFYPDLPKGYQISQYTIPLSSKGYLELKNKKFGITRIHLEEDTAKIIHEKGESLLDFNRAGVPLMELVTEPDFVTAKEAYNFAKELQLILRYLGVSDADMEKGQMRVEANISIRPEGQTKLGTKIEVKNLNSFKAVKEAIDYEIKRQAEALLAGEKVVQETRGWDSKKGITIIQREKEEAHDYRYFPEPDLPPLVFSEKDIQEVQAQVPEMPQKKRWRFEQEYGLKQEDIEVFIQNKDLGEYFEQVMSELREWLKIQKQEKFITDEEYKKIAQIASNYIISDLLGLLGNLSLESDSFLITAENFGEFISLIYFKNINSNIAKNILKEMFNTGKDPSDIIKEKGLKELGDEQELENLIFEVIQENPKAIKDWKKGKSNALQFLLGKIMAKTKGMANPKIATEVLTKLLKKL